MIGGFVNDWGLVKQLLLQLEFVLLILMATCCAIAPYS
jgi:phage gp36-like protein